MTTSRRDLIFQDTDKAREYLEALRWPEGPVSLHFGSVDDHKVTALSRALSLAHPRPTLKAWSAKAATCTMAAASSSPSR